MVRLAKAYKGGEFLRLKDISKMEAIPFDFLEKIVSDLEKAKLVKGKKGIGGGYVLSKSPKKINTQEIVKILEKTITPVDCCVCGRSKKCLTKSVWKKIDNAISKTLKNITLEDLIK